MLTKTNRLLVAWLTVASSSPFAYAGSCDDVYKDSTRNRYYSEADYASLNTVYDNICSASGEKKSLSWDSSMSVVLDAIPISMTGNGKSNSERADYFCHYYHSLRFDTSHSALARDEVVVAALNSYNACKEIEDRVGVVVTHKFADPDSIIVNFDFRNPNTFLRIDGVQPTNMICRSNEAPKGQQVLASNSHFEMRSNFAILCTRTHPNGNKSAYVPGSLAIGTNVTSYTLSVPSDSIYNNELASAATRKIAGLEAETQQLDKDRVALENKVKADETKLNGTKLVQHRIMIGQFNPGGGFEFYGCGTNLDVVRDSLCKGASQATIVKGNDVSGHQCGYADFVITCLYFGQ